MNGILLNDKWFKKMKIVFIVHYFPPVNSSGAKRVEAISKYLAAAGHSITVITTKKTGSDGAFTEVYPKGVEVIELDSLGRERQSIELSGTFEPMYTEKPSLKRRFKDLILNLFGQIPDPRLFFAFAFISPFLGSRVKSAVSSADVVIGSAPPWPMLLAAVFCKKRFNVPCVLDYRDHFSECHEMPGGAFAKWLELHIDRWLVSNADQLVTISDPMSSYYKTMSPNVTTIMNGYDHEVLDVARRGASENDADTVVIRYMGIVSPGRVPHNIMKALVRLKAHSPSDYEKFRIEFYGGCNLIKEAVKSLYPSIESAFFFYDSVPYLESLKLIVEADYLLFAETSSKNTLSAQGILTTKLFEYLGSGRPVLGDISDQALAGSFLKHGNKYNTVSVQEDVFFELFCTPDFYSRRENLISEFTHALSRQSQAFQYIDVIRLVKKAGS